MKKLILLLLLFLLVPCGFAHDGIFVERSMPYPTSYRQEITTIRLANGRYIRYVTVIPERFETRTIGYRMQVINSGIVTYRPHYNVYHLRLHDGREFRAITGRTVIIDGIIYTPTGLYGNQYILNSRFGQLRFNF